MKCRDIKIYLTYTLLFFLFEFSAQGQSFLYHTDPNLLPAGSQKVILTHDEGCIVLYDLASYNPIYLCRFDSNGINLWSKKFDFPGNKLIAWDIIELLNHSFKITGTEASTTGPYGAFFIMHVDSIGNLLSMVIDADSTHIPSGDVAICGKKNNDIFISALINIDPIPYNYGMLAQIDSGGNTVWLQYFSPDTNTYISSSVIGSRMDDGSIILSGFFSYINVPLSGYFFIAKFDSSGSILWTKNSEVMTHIDYPWSHKAVEINGNYFMTVGVGYTDSVNCYSISNSGTFNWNKKYGLFAGNSYLMKTHDNRLIIACSDMDLNYSSVNFEIDTSGNPVRRINFELVYPPFLTDIAASYETSSGKIISYLVESSTGIWEHAFASLDSVLQVPCVTAIYPNPQVVSYPGSMLSSGSTIPGTLGYTDITSSIVTSSYNLSSGDFCILLSDADMQLGEDFEIAPNPASTFINVHTNGQSENSELNIFNIAGQKVFSKPISGTSETIHIEHFARGIYFAQLQTEKGVSVKKLVVE
jgi:hypothetical protein